MKILLIVAVIFVLFILGVVLTGSLLPKRHVVSRSASYRATPERLFSLIAGDQKWRPELLRSEPVADAGGRELIRETTRDGETVTYETLDRKAPVSLIRRIATENLPYSGSWSYSLAPNGEATVVRITEVGEVYNPVFRFMSRFVIGHTRSMDNYLHALGKAVGQEVRITD
jgi:polyketide cyclase/dehydrase/lipid transport protein